MSLRLLVFGINYAPEPTGIGKYTGEMAEWLAARGHRVDAITALPHYPSWSIDPAYRDRGYGIETLRGVRVHRTPLRVGSGEGVGARRRILLESSFQLAGLRWWLPLLWRRRYDAVLAVCPPLQLALLPWIYRHLRGVPWIFHVQDLQVDAAQRLGLLDGPLIDLLFRLEGALLRRATRVSTITEPMRQRLLAKGVAAERTWLCPNWSDTDFVTPRAPSPELRRRLGAPDDRPLALYAGNMGEKQGLEVVLDVAERLRGLTPLHIAMVGRGAARPRLERAAHERGLTNVTFHDLFPWEEVPELLAAGDIHLVVQRREAADLVMPSKLTNILAAGRPSIATAEPGTALYHALTEGDSGWVVPPDDPERITEALLRLSRDGSARRRMGANARSYAEAHLGKDAILERFERQLLTLIETGVPA